VQEAWAASSTG